LIDKEGVKMVFGGSASSVAIAAGEVCKEKGVVFFGTLTYSTATTGAKGHRHIFRECYNAWPGAKAIASFLKAKYAGKKYFYVTADYTWGHTTEASVRKFTGTEDKNVHKGILTPFPGAKDADFKKAIAFAKMIKPDVLVLVLFGKDMERGIRQATAMGLKSKMQIVVPNLTLGMAEGGGPKVMEGVIGAVPWCWQVPYKYNYSRGKEFVEKFAARHNRYPSTSGASAYTILYEYKAAVERAGSFDTPAVIKALEGHEYQLLKDKQIWRDFDHQSIQTVYAVKCKPQAEVLKDKYKLDYFEIISSLPGEKAFRTRQEWNAVRTAAGKPTHLE
jgi:ABC-type branched-subunit amino acid transport system substrate-binding protein